MEFINPVQEHLQDVEDRMRSRFNGSASGLISILDQLICLGGKRLRPTVTLLMGKMLGADLDHLLDLAAAIEMLHTATLIHDDLVDDATLRRGEKTINATLPPVASVLAGDLVFAIAANLAAATKSVRVMEIFAETLATMVNGEITNLFDNKPGNDREMYFQWIYAKTASMFELATGAAAILSKADVEAISTARQFGREIGMAFQIVDDVLDFTGSPADIGKPVGNDLRQGVFTLPTLHYLETHPEDPDLRSVINRNGHDEESLNRLIAAINASDAVNQSMHEAERFVQSGLETLAVFPDILERQALEELTRFILSRTK
ncbi:MAG: polyprenyl synthetase family protein [Anaerolineales bacterium]|nr:polyprenyl synthetase family protein [Anaerolineales bacterium]